MALAVSAVDVLSDGNPSSLVTVSGLSSVVGAGTVTVKRYQTFDRWNGSAVNEDVRGISDLDVTGDTAVASDFEYSFTGDIWQYQVIVYDSSGDQLAAALDPGTQNPATYRAYVEDYYDGYATAILSVPTQPVLNLGVSIQEFSNWKYGVTVLNQAKVLGQANPVVSNDLNFSRSGTFLLNAGDSVFAQDITTLIGTLYRPYTFMFRPLYVSSGFRDCYFNLVGDVDVTRYQAVNSQEASNSNVSEVDFSLSIPFQEVDRLDTFGEGTTIVTWQDVLDENADWSAVNSGHPDWLDVLNTAGT